MVRQYVMRYKRQPQGVTTGLIEASSLAKAEELGLAYCEGKAGHTFIRVEDPVLVREEGPGEWVAEAMKAQLAEAQGEEGSKKKSEQKQAKNV